MKIAVDFSRKTGEIKPVHGVNNSPVRLRDEKIPEFEEAGIPYVRTHDTGGAYGGGVFIDVPNIFRNFDADADDPASYDFVFTDVYLRSLVNSGCRIFYRLGVTIENFHDMRAYRIQPPKDFRKWAKICEMIIRHYNHGWADGFHYGIEYWEIWNEPENKPMWSGTQEQFFRLYAVASRHLKNCFPEIRVGGYASCGFHTTTRKNPKEVYKVFVPYYHAFLDFVCREKVPLDFFSYHLYTHDPEEIVKHSGYVERTLKEAGLHHVEQIFNEWNLWLNTHGAVIWDYMKEFPTALEVARTFCLMQHSFISKAMYYDAQPNAHYCGLFYFPSERVTPTYYAFKAFNELYKRRNEVKVKGCTKRCPALAAADEKSGAVLILNLGKKEKEIELDFSKGLKAAKISLMTEGITYKDAKYLLKGKILTLPGRSLAVLQIPFESGISGEKNKKFVYQTKGNFDGIEG